MRQPTCRLQVRDQRNLYGMNSQRIGQPAVMGKHRKDKAESDVEPDPHRADSREIGGVPEPDAPDQASTTGTTPSEDYVGRVAGTDIGYAEETGAECRSEDDCDAAPDPPDS